MGSRKSHRLAAKTLGNSGRVVFPDHEIYGHLCRYSQKIWLAAAADRQNRVTPLWASAAACRFPRARMGGDYRRESGWRFRFAGGWTAQLVFIKGSDFTGERPDGTALPPHLLRSPCPGSRPYADRFLDEDGKAGIRFFSGPSGQANYEFIVGGPRSAGFPICTNFSRGMGHPLRPMECCCGRMDMTDGTVYYVFGVRGGKNPTANDIFCSPRMGTQAALRKSFCDWPHATCDWPHCHSPVLTWTPGRGRETIC